MFWESTALGSEKAPAFSSFKCERQSVETIKIATIISFDFMLYWIYIIRIESILGDISSEILNKINEEIHSKYQIFNCISLRLIY